MSKASTTIVGVSIGAVAVLVIFIVLVWFCKFHCKKFSNKNSETGSSDPSTLGKIFLEAKLGKFPKVNYDTLLIRAGNSSQWIGIRLAIQGRQSSSHWRSWSKLQNNSMKTI